MHFLKPTLFLFCLSLLLTMVSGCQLTNKQSSATAHLASYYLWLKQLNQSELNQEVSLQKKLQAENNQQADIRLAILHSISSSPIHNPYTAKALLNKLTQPEIQNNEFNIIHLAANDLAFVTMLKEQLNEQLLSLAKIVAKEQQLHITNQDLRTKQHNLEHLNHKVTQLEQQIKQLKHIEQAINKRGNN